VRSERRTGAGRAQRALRPVDERDTDLPLERRQLLRNRRLRVSEDSRRSRDGAEVEHQGERPEALRIAGEDEATLLDSTADEVVLMPSGSTIPR
jgi:hypothetical protein